jgi:POT family proton-dependent oligopeptide transporter
MAAKRFIVSSREITSDDRSRVIGFLPLFIVNVGFWSLYQQQFTVLTIYSDQRLDRSLGGWEMPVSWINSINPVFVIILSGVLFAITRWPAWIFTSFAAAVYLIPFFLYMR